VEEDEKLIAAAIDTDFRRACEIMKLDPEKVQNDPNLFAEVAFFLMIAEAL